MSKQEIATVLNQLESIVRKMEVPSYHIRNVAWLKKNLAARNEQHPEYPIALNLINRLWSYGVAKG